MAKWGEGDPRWIVEDRPDATNVNNWHWTMKDASGWSKNKLKEFLIGLKFEDTCIGSWKVKELSSMEGEASANNRKGNLIILYDWNIKAKIKGSAPDGKEDEGTINISNFSDDYKMNDIEIIVSLDGSPTSLSKCLADSSRSTLIDILTKYVSLLKNEYSQGVILPSHNKAAGSGSTSSQDSKKQSKSSSQTTVTTSSSKAEPVKIPTKRVKLKESFKCPIEEIYNVFVTEELVSAFTRSKASVAGQKGGRFSFMNGEIMGEFLELDRPNKIVERWRSKNWPPEHYSNVTILFQQDDDGTTLTMTQTGIPEFDHERTKDGWKRFIFEPIKRTFGFGATLL